MSSLVMSSPSQTNGMLEDNTPLQKLLCFTSTWPSTDSFFNY